MKCEDLKGAIALPLLREDKAIMRSPTPTTSNQEFIRLLVHFLGLVSNYICYMHQKNLDVLLSLQWHLSMESNY
ncbi:hypothetical protein IQ277_25655 [Nostocales cyanobacterium LEGE 12452]|nr:hypothetical protein [Nostocales cyanobacterium LEGE 12452]